jgi:hypothetical protein
MRTHHPHLPLLASVLLLSALVAAPASAFTPPSGSKCQNTAAGYLGLGSSTGRPGDAKAWLWDGRLTWQACVVPVLSAGVHYAKIQLSSPVTVDKYDRFTGLVNVWLEGCFGTGHVVYETLAQGNRSVPQYDPGTQTGNRYYFPTIQTAQSTVQANSYRVHIQTWVAGVVARTVLGPILALSSKGMATGQGTDYNYYSGCMIL